MNEQNIMENNEVMEAAEEIVKTNSGLGVKIVGGVLIGAGAIYGAIKLRKMIKAKREESATVNVVEDENIEARHVEVEEETIKKHK